MSKHALLRGLTILLIILGITLHPSAVNKVMAQATSDPVSTGFGNSESEITEEAPSEEAEPSNEVGAAESDTAEASQSSDLTVEISANIVHVKSVPEIVEEASAVYRLDVNRMLLISWCESKHGKQTIGSGHLGVFQFAARTWSWASIDAGFGIWDENQKRLVPPDPNDVFVNIWTAAWLANRNNYADWPRYRSNCTG